MHNENMEPHVEESEPYGKKIGILAAVLAGLLSIVSISGHREHTETIILQNDSTNLWSHYQAKRIRAYQIEMNLSLLPLFDSSNPATTKLKSVYAEQQVRYREELTKLNLEAAGAVKESLRLQKKTFYFDFSEGMLEIAIIMCSLYFISHKKFFPHIGLVFGIVGLVAGFIGFM